MKNHTRFKFSLITIVLATVTVSSQAFALDKLTDANQNTYVESFKALDIDGSNSLSKSEVKNEKLFSKNFSAADKNGDGSLDQQEYTCNHPLKSVHS